MIQGSTPEAPSALTSVLLCCFIILAAVLSAPAGLAGAEEMVRVKDVRHWSSAGYTRIAVDLTGPVQFTDKRISSPDRLFFDLMNSKISKEIKTSLPVGDGILKTVRVGQFNADTVRVVLDLENIKDYNAFMLSDPVRLIIDVNGLQNKLSRPEDVVPAPKKKIVLDPGHGGHDPGAVGRNGLYEKDVVLDIALKLKRLLSSDPGLEILLTRDRDIFIPLEERTAFANKKNADLFISIHANASPKKAARGIETYLLNWTDDEGSMRVAARENAISFRKMKEAQTELGMILASLERDKKRDESLKLADYVHNTMVSTLSEDYSFVINNGVKQALFYVLVGARMPSVLVEVSFISNAVEGKMLATDSYRLKIANGLSDGIVKYTASLPAWQRVAGSGY